jgi:L-fuculose-phosphate aldolase
MTLNLHRGLRDDIIAACLEMNHCGINQGKAGNISVRVEEGCLITPSGVDYDLLTPEQIAAIDLDGMLYEGGSTNSKPSSEWRMHVDIYRHFPLAGAVLHAHSPFATALACNRRGIPAFHYMVAIAGGDDIRCARYATFGTPELSRHMLEALQDRSACLLANHGMICFGGDLREALWRAVEVESLARQYVLALGVGAPTLLDDSQMAEVIERFRHYGNPRRD